eukprot:m.5225 g.5225  ORF g.5225 m.5225 type:complete len:76 (-) comp3441_c0_seq1:60-287(-)
MSTRAKATLAASCVFTVGMVAFVHWNQQQDRQLLKVGVVKDLERQQKKRERLADLHEQQKLHDELAQEQGTGQAR